MSKVVTWVLAFGSILLAVHMLAGCTAGPTWQAVRKDEAIWDRVERRPYQPLDRLIVACVQHRGTFTQDRRACMVYRPGVCYFLTAPGDQRHDQELTAFCNGFTPTRGKT